MKVIITLIIGCFLLLSNQSLAQQPVYTQNTSSPTACDGSAILDSSIVYTSVVWMSNGAVIQQGGNYVGNLCAGTYIVTYSTALGVSTTLTFTIGSGTTNPCTGFGVLVSSIDATDSTTCDGSATLTVYGGTSPYTFSWSQGSTTSTVNSLCIGTYSVCVTDANGCVSCENASISAPSTQPDSLLIFSNNNFPGTPVAGILATASVEDCTIDYQNVGSAGVTSSVQMGDTLIATWTLLDTMGNVVSTYTINYYVPASANGLYSLTLIVFCSQKSTNYNTIQVNDHVMLSSNALDFVDESLVKVVNPMTHELTLIYSELASGKISIVDATGKQVFFAHLNASFKSTFDVSELRTGIYMMEAEVNGKKYRTKLIK